MKKQMIISTIIIGMLLSTVPIGTVGEEAVRGEQPIVEELFAVDEGTLFDHVSGDGEPIQCISNDDSENLQKIIPDYVQGQIIVKFKDNNNLDILKSSNGIISTGLDSVDELNIKYKVKDAEKILKHDMVPSLSNVYVFNFSTDESVYSAVGDFKKDSNIEYVEPNYIHHLSSGNSYDPVIIPNDPYFKYQWALDNTGQMYPSDGRYTTTPWGTADCDIDAPETWMVETGDDDVVVAVIDTGVDYTHPDLAENIWINEEEDINNNGKFDKWPWWLGGDIDRKDNDGNRFVDDVVGWNFEAKFYEIFDDNDPMDDHGHGTHCAGIIGAVGNNNIGISGICWNCKIMPVKFLGSNGSGTTDDAVDAIIYAANNGADVISMSFGCYCGSKIIREAIDYAYNKDVVLVAAAGNDGTSLRSYPASYDNVIAVAATDSNDVKASFSNYGEWVDVAAPGVDILSLRAKDTDMYGDGAHIVYKDYYIASGTSMACPHVAGLAALILSNKELSNPTSIIRTLIRNTGDPIGSPEYISSSRINAYKALLREPAIAILDNHFPGWADVKNRVEIKGTAWSEVFQYYTVSYRIGKGPETWEEVYGIGKVPETWIEIAHSTFTSDNKLINNTVVDGVLALLDTKAQGLLDGLYTVKLKVVCTDGVYEDKIQIIVNNEENTIHVDDDNINEPWDGTSENPFQYIRDGVDIAGKGDTVYVHNGKYRDNLFIYKSIKLIGENRDKTSFRSRNCLFPLIYISHLGDSPIGTKISGFTIQPFFIFDYIYLVENIDSHIVGNNIDDNGLWLKDSENCYITENNFTNNSFIISYSSDNMIYHNNFFNDYPFLSNQDYGKNDWDDGSEGNYWDDYIGPDYLPPYGIGDTPRFIFPYITGNRDRCPLMEPYPITAGYNPNI